MSDRNETVVASASRALIETGYYESKAYRLAEEYYENSTGYLAGANMIERICMEVDFQALTKEKEKEISAVKAEAY